MSGFASNPNSADTECNSMNSFNSSNEFTDSQMTPKTASASSPMDRTVTEKQSNSFNTTGHSYDKEHSITPQEMIVNNHEAHQHSPPKCPLRDADGTPIIEPAHSHSIAKNSSSCGAVPLIKLEQYEEITPYEENKELPGKTNIKLEYDESSQDFAVNSNNQQSNSEIVNSSVNESLKQDGDSIPTSNWIHKINNSSKMCLQDQNVVVLDNINLKSALVLTQPELTSRNKFIIVRDKNGKEVKVPVADLQNCFAEESEKLLKTADSMTWNFSEDKGISNEHISVSQSRIQETASWVSSHQAPIQHPDVDSWLEHVPLQTNQPQNGMDNFHVGNYEDTHSPSADNGDIWKKKREMDAHRAWEEQCQEIKQNEMTYSMLKESGQDINKASIICQDSGISKAEFAHNQSNQNYAYTVIQDSKVWQQASETTSPTYVLMDGTQSKLFVSKPSISETTDHMQTDWHDENKNKTTDSQQWMLENAHIHADMTAGDPWVYQTVSSGAGQPIETHTGDGDSRLRSDNSSHSLPPTPPSREGPTPRPAPMSQSLAPSVGEKDQASSAGTSSASDSVMVSTFGSMAPYSMAGNYTSPPSYSGRDLYPGKPSSGYETSPPSSATLYASPTSGLAMLPYVAGQSMGGHQSMVSQSGHHWSGSQPSSVHEHQQSAGGYGISALTSGLNLGQNSLNLSTSQSGSDQGELGRSAGFATFAASSHGYIRPDMSHWGLLDHTMPGLHNSYCADGIPPHLAQGK